MLKNCKIWSTVVSTVFLCRFGPQQRGELRCVGSPLEFIGINKFFPYNKPSGEKESYRKERYLYWSWDSLSAEKAALCNRWYRK